MIHRKIWKTYNKMSVLQRILVFIFLSIMSVFGILFLVYNERIFGWLGPAAAKWRDVPGGWVILFALNFITAFPPLIGYSSTVTIAGFVYGFPNGWFIVASATILGSLCSFLASRTVLSAYVQRLVGEDKRFTALALTLKHDGLKILCMIRFCPLPYSLSNAAMSTFPGVNPLMFALATAISTPKLLIHVFIGSRMASLAGGHQDFSTKIINYVSIGGGIIVGGAAGWIIYRRTMQRAAQLETEEEEQLRAAGLPLPGEARPGRGGYTDGPIRDQDDVLMGEDDISLWENEIDSPRTEEEGYRDDFTDDEGNPFAAGDLDEEAAISSKTRKQSP